MATASSRQASTSRRGKYASGNSKNAAVHKASRHLQRQFEETRSSPPPIKKPPGKRPSKNAKKRQLRDALDIPGISSKVNAESRALVPGEGILSFFQTHAAKYPAESSKLPAESSNPPAENTDSPADLAPPPQQTSNGDQNIESADFISLDFDDNTTDLGRKFSTFEEEESNANASSYDNEFACPWLGPEQHSSARDQLSHEVLEFLRYMSPTQTEIQKREECVSRLRKLVQQLWPRSNVTVFGSYATGMYLPDADIDVVINSDSMRAKIKSEMYRLSSKLRTSGVAKSVTVISHARVPIVKYVEARSGINVDIAFTQGSGPDAVSRVSRWLDDNSALKPIAMVVRQFLKRRNLSDVATGGLGGYATICLAYSRLQQRLREIDGHPLKNLGVLLIDFFDFYGNVFNNSTQYVRPRSAPYCTPVAKRLNSSMATPQQVGLAIEDPSDTSNNISKASYNYPTVKRSFANAADYMKALCLEWHKLPPSQRSLISFLAPILKFTGDEPERTKVPLDRALSIIRLEQPKSQGSPNSHSRSPSPERSTPSRRPRPPQGARRTPNKPSEDVHAARSDRRKPTEKGRGVERFDPWNSSSLDDTKDSSNSSKDLADRAYNMTLPASSGARSGQKRSASQVSSNGSANGRANGESPLTKPRHGSNSSDNDDNDSRTKLTTAQRRQFWSRKSGTPEPAPPK